MCICYTDHMFIGMYGEYNGINKQWRRKMFSNGEALIEIIETTPYPLMTSCLQYFQNWGGGHQPLEPPLFLRH